MGYVLLWMLIISLIGWVSLPITFILLGSLRDRGIAFIRTVGLLLWGIVFWLFSVFGLLKNNIAGIVFSLFLMTGFSIWIFIKNHQSILSWIKENRSIIIFTELVFVISFFGFCALAWFKSKHILDRKTNGIGFHQFCDSFRKNAPRRSLAFRITQFLITILDTS